MKPINIMKPIDIFLSDQVFKLQENPEYQKIMDRYSSLDDNEQISMKFFMMAIVTLLPVVIIGSFYFMNSSKKQELAVKSEIILLANSIIEKDNGIKRVANKVFGREVSSESQFKTQISTTISRAGIDIEKVKISGIELEEISTGINQLTANIKFNGFSSANLYSFLRNLNINKKIKIEEIDIKKNTTSNLLDGVLAIFYYSKISDSDRNE